MTLDDRDPLFKDFGILPEQVSAQPHLIVAEFSPFQLFGQVLGTLLISGLGLFCTWLLAFRSEFPGNVLGSLAMIALFGYIVYRGTRNDYSWVRVEGTAIRAQHLYTRRLLDREIRDIEDISTMVIPGIDATSAIHSSLFGRIRGVRIRFRESKDSIDISLADPAMKGAKNLIEAIIGRMAQCAEITADIEELQGKPLVRRIRWKQDSSAAS